MPPVPSRLPKFPTLKAALFEIGLERVLLFCERNGILAPTINLVARKDWHVNACAYYRPDTTAVKKFTRPGVSICLEHCGRPCTDAPGRNWTWPGSTTDREPYGVLAHELGHHCDYLAGEKKGSYYSEYCGSVKDESGEAGVSSYADENPAEWLAEAFRLLVTNPDLLRQLRPRTYEILVRRWTPVGPMDWRYCLGSNVPAKVLRTLQNKGAK